MGDGTGYVVWQTSKQEWREIRTISVSSWVQMENPSMTAVLFSEVVGNK